MTPPYPQDAAEKLRVVVQNWGREVTDAQMRLEEQIRAAASELSQIEGLLSQRSGQALHADMLRELERLRAENAELRKALTASEARIRALTGGT